MAEYTILVVVALAGYTDAPWWFVLLGAAGITIEGWWLKLRLLRQPPSVPLSSKIITYFVTGVATNIGFAALSYLVGRMLRLWLQ